MLMMCVALLPAGFVPSARAAAEDADRAALEKQLADARERLDDAARDVAELSGKLYGDTEKDVVRFVHGGPRGAMLGVNIGGGDGRDDGVEIRGVSPGGPAEAAGLRTGDVIVAVNGRSIKQTGDRSPERELVEYMRSVEPGQKVKVEYLRSGKRQAAEVTTRRAEPAMARMLREGMVLPMPEGIELPHFEEFLAPHRGLRSLELVSMTPKLGQYFGTEKGLLVVRAPADGAFRLEEGDVLLTIGGRTPEGPGHAFRILDSYEAGEKVQIGVIRNRRQMTLETVVPVADRARPAPLPRPLLPPAAPAAPIAPPKVDPV
jgi:predicted metalloprotease with PDZ domain